MNKNKSILTSLVLIIFLTLIGTIFTSCGSQSNGSSGGALGTADAASQVYVAPGEKDEYYAFLSGGFSGQVTVHGQHVLFFTSKE